VRFAVRAGNVGQYSPFVHVALPGALDNDTWSGVLIALAEPVDAAPDDAAIAAELIDTFAVALIGVEADNAITLLQQAFENANTWLRDQNAARGSRRKVVLGLSCLLLIGDDLFVAQVPPGQIMIRQDAELFAFPALESWSTTFQPDHTYELPNPLGLRSRTEPQIFYTRTEPGDQVFALSSSVAKGVLSVQDALCQASSLEQTERLLLDIAVGLGVESGYGAVMEIPSERRPGWWRGRQRDDDAPADGGFQQDTPKHFSDDMLSPIRMLATLQPPFVANSEKSPRLALDQKAPNMQTERAEPVALSWLGSHSPGSPGDGRALSEARPDGTETRIDELESSRIPTSQPAKGDQCQCSSRIQLSSRHAIPGHGGNPGSRVKVLR